MLLLSLLLVIDLAHADGAALPLVAIAASSATVEPRSISTDPLVLHDIEALSTVDEAFLSCPSSSDALAAGERVLRHPFNLVEVTLAEEVGLPVPPPARMVDVVPSPVGTASSALMRREGLVLIVKARRLIAVHDRSVTSKVVY